MTWEFITKPVRSTNAVSWEWEWRCAEIVRAHVFELS